MGYRRFVLSTNPLEQESAHKIAQVMRTARKGASLSQIEVARHLGISQGGLSKLESGYMILSAPLWFEFCQLTGVPSDSLMTGIVERNHLASLQTDSRVGSYRLPKKFSEQRGSKVKAMLPFLHFSKEKLGEKKYDEYMSHIGVDQDFFFDFDNQINLSFCLEVSRMLVQKGFLKVANLFDLVSQVSKPSLHGGSHTRYSAAESGSQLLGFLINNSRQYECNFQYTIQSQKKTSIDFSVEPEPFLEAFSYRNDPTLGDFLCRYKKGYFESFLHYGRGAPKNVGPKVEEVECHYHGAKRCLYQVKFQA